VDALSWLEHYGIPARIAKAIEPILMELWEDAWDAGGGAAGQPVPSQVKQYRARWLSQVTQTRVQQIAAILAKGGTAAALAAAILAVLKDVAAALLIAVTEVFRAMNGALLASYRAQRVGMVRWVTRSANPCPICLANEAEGPKHLGEPFSSGDQAPPAHPNCECVLIPAGGE
jgi:hypothetical protein